MYLYHLTLKELLHLDTHLPFRLRLLSLAAPENAWPRRLLARWPLTLRRLVGQQLMHLGMGLRALRHREADALLIMELFSYHSALLLPVLAATRKPTFIFSFWDQQLAQHSPFRRAGFLLLRAAARRFGFYILLPEIDDTELPPSYRYTGVRRVVLPMPVQPDLEPLHPAAWRPSASHTYRIGLVGAPRKGKPLFAPAILEAVQAFVKHSPIPCEVVLGAPLQRATLPRLDIPHRTVDTGPVPAYQQLLRSCDIVVLNYARDDYHFRSSGVVQDAASAGAFVVCPAYPVMAHQISWPVPVGATFADPSNLARALETGLRHRQQHGVEAHWAWRGPRTAQPLAKRLSAALHEAG